MPMRNAARWLEEALQSVAAQTFAGSLELSVFDDASTVSLIRHFSTHRHARQAFMVTQIKCPYIFFKIGCPMMMII